MAGKASEEQLWEFQTRLMEEVNTIWRTCRNNSSTPPDGDTLKTYLNTMPSTMVVPVGTPNPQTAASIGANSILSETSSEITADYKFVNLPQSIVMLLTPKVEVYKVYTEETGDEGDKTEMAYLLHQGAYTKDSIRRALSNRSITGADDNMQGVVVEAVEFTRLGGNPAEVHTNIKFNIRLYAKSIAEFFTKTDAFPDTLTATTSMFGLEEALDTAQEAYSGLTSEERVRQGIIDASSDRCLCSNRTQFAPKSKE